MSTVIQVRMKHIKKGKRGDKSACALKLAIKEHLAYGVWLNVGDGEILLSTLAYSEKDTIVALPAVAEDFRVRFDQSKNDVGPTMFVLGIPSRFLAEGGAP